MGPEAAPGAGLGLVKASGGGVRRGQRIAPAGLRVRIIYIAIGAMNNYYQNRVRAASGSGKRRTGRFPAPEIEVQAGLMVADLEKIITADLNGREAVAQTQQEALALKNQAEARVREIQERLQEELAQVRQEAQSEILAEAEARAREIGAATERRIQELTENFQARREEAAALLIARVLGT